MEVLFDLQFLWKESYNVFSFLHADNPERKVASKTTTLGWVYPGLHQVLSDCRIL